MTTAQYLVELEVNKNIVGFCQVSANSPQEAAEIIGGSLRLNAKRYYEPISPRTNGVIINNKKMNNETIENNTNDTQEETPITAMHEVTPQDKETQEGLEDVEVGEVVPMSPAAAEQDKGLRPDLA
jgi:hypothetical protein